MSAANSSLAAQVTTLKTNVGTIQSNSVLALNGKLGLNGTAAVCTGVDVQITNGSGKTQDATPAGFGGGNLIIGYNEPDANAREVCTDGSSGNISPGNCVLPAVWKANQHTGYHNLVIGYGHSYTSYGGLVVGSLNAINNAYASVSGGTYNVASGKYSSVSGGYYSASDGESSSVSGGGGNSAAATGSSVSGGFYNTAGGWTSSISGGWNGTASGTGSSVSGGDGNIALGNGSSVSGGRGNTAEAIISSVSGGRTVNDNVYGSWAAGSLTSP